MNANVVHTLVALLLLCCNGKVRAATSAVTSAQDGQVLRLDNGRMSISHDARQGSFQLSSGGLTFVAAGKLPQGPGKASLVAANDLLGNGRAIVVDMVGWLQVTHRMTTQLATIP